MHKTCLTIIQNVLCIIIYIIIYTIEWQCWVVLEMAVANGGREREEGSEGGRE